MRFSKYTILIILLCSFLFVQAGDDETEFCPGRGERCAYIKVLGVKIWSKKDKDAPGIIIKSEN